MKSVRRESVGPAPVVRAIGVVPSEGLQRGPDVSTRPGDRQATYRELRERTKRRELGREENVKRIVELHRERRLHLLENRDVALGAVALD